MKDPKSSAYWCDHCAREGVKKSAVVTFHPQVPDLCERHIVILRAEAHRAACRSLITNLLMADSDTAGRGTVH